MLGLGMGELTIIGMIALLFVGPTKIPELGRGLGEGIRSFKKALRFNNDKSDAS